MVNINKLKVVGILFVPEIKYIPLKKKKDICLFPHRLSVEKRSGDFVDLERIVKDKSFSNYEFIRSRDIVSTKKEFYRLLESSKISISLANQETFGIAMYESLMAGCFCLVPDRLSYSELYKPIFLYKNDFELVYKLEEFIFSDQSIYQKEIDHQRNIFLTLLQNGIKKLIKEFKKGEKDED